MSLFGAPTYTAANGSSPLSLPSQNVSVGDLLIVDVYAFATIGDNAVTAADGNVYAACGAQQPDGSGGFLRKFFCVATIADATHVPIVHVNCAAIFTKTTPTAGATITQDGAQYASNATYTPGFSTPAITTTGDDFVSLSIGNENSANISTVDSPLSVGQNENGEVGVCSGEYTTPQTALVINGTMSGSAIGTLIAVAFKAVIQEVVSVSASPASGTYPFTCTGTVTLAEAAIGNTAVTLASSDITIATVPASVTVLNGNTTATFPITILDKTGSTTISATFVQTVTTTVGVTAASPLVDVIVSYNQNGTKNHIQRWLTTNRVPGVNDSGIYAYDEFTYWRRVTV
jgi:hypothetical protein